MRDRFTDVWDAYRIERMLDEVDKLSDLVTISGGFAWHFMSPPHVEYRRFHDMKDLDLFVAPKNAGTAIAKLLANGYERQWTKYDGISKDFYRYTKYAADGKVMIDLFVKDIPNIIVGGRRLVQPPELLKLYETSHSSKHCVAVQAAMKLVANGINPIGRAELIGSRHADSP